MITQATGFHISADTWVSAALGLVAIALVGVIRLQITVRDRVIRMLATMYGSEKENGLVGDMIEVKRDVGDIRSSFQKVSYDMANTKDAMDAQAERFKEWEKDLRAIMRGETTLAQAGRRRARE